MIGCIFLSASVPNRPPYDQACDPIAIREAVVGLVSAVLPEGELVFGGHPAISPLVEHAATTLGAVQNVHIFQSRWFEEIIPPVARRFQNFHWTPRETTKEASLELMRNTMLEFRDYRAGVFIGGMEGIKDEFNLFRRKFPNAPVYPIASTKGATDEVFRERDWQATEELRHALKFDKCYRALFRRLLPDSEQRSLPQSIPTRS